MTRAPVPLAAALCLLAGCAVSPGYRAPAPDLPARWSSTKADAAPDPDTARWWTGFADAELDSLIRRALAGNPDLVLAGARIREARAAAKGAGAALSPSLAANAAIAGERESANAPNPVVVQPDGRIESPSQSELQLQGGLTAAWEIDLFGANRRRAAAAAADLEATRFDREAAALSLIAEVARTYVDLREAQQLALADAEALEGRRQSLAIARARLDSGMAAGSELNRAETEFQSATLAPIADRAAADGASYRLALLLGLPPTALTAELAGGGPIPAAPGAPPMGLPSDLLRRRPDIRGAERRLAAASARLGAATADLYPKFSLLGGAGLASQTATDFFDPASLFWTIGPSLSWPILDGGRLAAQIEIRDARQQQALILYRRAILNGVADVEAAALRYRSDLEVRGRLQAIAGLEGRGVGAARSAFLGGHSDARPLLAAEASALPARRALVRNRAALARDLVALYGALGGGWKAEGR